MVKKEYQTPKMNVVKLKRRENLLQSSEKVLHGETGLNDYSDGSHPSV